MDVRKIVAWNLRLARVRKDLSQEKLAVDAGLDRTYVGRLERALENPTVVVLDRLARALAIDIGDFFTPPKPGERPPEPLRGGRRKSDAARASKPHRRA